MNEEEEQVKQGNSDLASLKSNKLGFCKGGVCPEAGMKNTSTVLKV